VRDDKRAIRDAIDASHTADFIVSTGGVSVGEHDHVKAVLAELGAELVFWRVNMKPGKPLAVATVGETPFFGLPGNPVSAVTSFWLFLRPAIRKALGCENIFLWRAQARISQKLTVKGERPSYLRAKVRAEEATLVAEVFALQGSHMVSSLVGANAMVLATPGDHAAGDALPVLITGPLA
jgi:molybdopterin molybdotransferase